MSSYGYLGLHQLGCASEMRMRTLASTLLVIGNVNAFKIPNFLNIFTGNEIQTEEYFIIDDNIVPVFFIGIFASLMNSLFLVEYRTGNGI